MRLKFIKTEKPLTKVALAIVFIIYLLITLLFALKHQPWRDEAQSWLIARDLNPIGIIRQMPYEGTPPLWHFILYPFAASGLPYSTEFIINYLLVAAAIFLLIFFSPLPKSIKLILPLSYYFLFEYSVVARNYSLVIFSLFLVAVLYQKRLERPIIYALAIAIFALSSIQALGIAAILTTYFLIETIQKKLEARKYLIAIIIMLAAQLAVIFMLLPYPNQLYAGLGFNGLNFFAKAAAAALFPFFDNPYMPAVYSWILTGAWLILVPCLLKTKIARILYLGSSTWMMFIILFKHSGYIRHYGLFLLVFIFAWWLDIYYQPLIQKPKKLIYFSALTLLLVCLAGGAGYSAYYYYTNQNLNFSGAKEMANYLKDNNLLTEEIATYPAITGSALLPYLPSKKFYQMERGEEGTFSTWDYKARYDPLRPYWEIKNDLQRFYEQAEIKPKSILILTTWPLGYYDRSLIFVSANKKQSLTDEYFYLYRFNLPPDQL